MTAITHKGHPSWFNGLLLSGPDETIAMKHKQLRIALACAALMASGLATAGEIYKWTDTEGNVHYEDRPIGPANVEHMNIVSRNTDDAAVQARIDANRAERAVRQQVAEEAPPEMTREEIRAEQQERAEKCQMYRDRLQAFLRSTRLYEEDDAGERTYLDDDEVMAARARVEDQIQEYCGA